MSLVMVLFYGKLLLESLHSKVNTLIILDLSGLQVSM